MKAIHVTIKWLVIKTEPTASCSILVAYYIISEIFDYPLWYFENETRRFALTVRYGPSCLIDR